MCFETVVLTPATCHGRMNVKIEIGSCLVLPRFLYALLHLPATSPPGSHMDLEALHPHAAFSLFAHQQTRQLQTRLTISLVPARLC